MPRRRKSDLSRRSRNAIRIRNRVNETNEEERKISREGRRVSMARLRASQSKEQSEAARETARLAMRNRRANLRGQQLEKEERPARRAYSCIDLNQAEFRYDCNTEYSLHASASTNANGSMQAVSWPMPKDIVCGNCGALNYSGQPPGLCCLNLKVEVKIEEEDIF